MPSTLRLVAPTFALALLLAPVVATHGWATRAVAAQTDDDASCEIPPPIAADAPARARPAASPPPVPPSSEPTTGPAVEVAPTGGTPGARSPQIVTVSGTPLVIAPRRAAPATPAAEEPAIGIDEASGTAESAATAEPPAASEAPDPNAALAEELTAVARALGACLSDGDAETVADLATEAYLGQLYGGGTPLSREAYLAIAPDLDDVPTDVRAITDVRRASPDEASAEVVQVVGNQLLRGRWSFVRQSSGRDDDESPWRVDGESPLPVTPPEGSQEVAVVLSDFAFSLDEPSVEGPDVTLVGANEADQDHEMLVLRFDAGLGVGDLLRAVGPSLPDGVAYVGQATVPAGGEANLTLVDLEPGDYALVCLFLDAQGQPHAALGMSTTFTVTG